MFKKLLAFFTGGSAESKSAAPQTVAVKDGGGSLRDLEAFVEFVVMPLVDDPDAVSIKTVEYHISKALEELRKLSYLVLLFF